MNMIDDPLDSDPLPPTTREELNRLRAFADIDVDASDYDTPAESSYGTDPERSGLQFHDDAEGA